MVKSKLRLISVTERVYERLNKIKDKNESVKSFNDAIIYLLLKSKEG